MTVAVRFEAWDRRQGIGASELAALAGVSPWGTPASVWLDKVGLGTPRETDAMVAGRDLETTVLRMAAKRVDLRLVGNRMTFPHPDYPATPLYATPDGFTRPGRSALVECKVVAHRFDDWKGGPPEYVDLQVQGQLACLPRVQGAIVAALIGGDVKTWRVDRDQARIDALEANVRAWWADHVLGDRAPEPTGDDDRWALVRATVHTDARMERIATPDEQRIGTDLRGLIAARTALDADIEDRRLALAEYAQDSDIAGLGWRATWTQRSSVDWRALAADLAIALVDIERHTRQAAAFTFRKDGDA